MKKIVLVPERIQEKCEEQGFDPELAAEMMMKLENILEGKERPEIYCEECKEYVPIDIHNPEVLARHLVEKHGYEQKKALESSKDFCKGRIKEYKKQLRKIKLAFKIMRIKVKVVEDENEK